MDNLALIIAVLSKQHAEVTKRALERLNDDKNDWNVLI